MMICIGHEAIEGQPRCPPAAMAHYAPGGKVWQATATFLRGVARVPLALMSMVLEFRLTGQDNDRESS
jgi:hypothetical protein